MRQPLTAPAAPAVRPETTAPAAARPVAAASGDTYTVRRADTLYKIAHVINPDSAVTDRQAMVALYRANPQAFDGNVNNVLRAGSVLRIPATADMAAISNSEASAELSRQYGAWRACSASGAHWSSS